MVFTNFPDFSPNFPEFPPFFPVFPRTVAVGPRLHGHLRRVALLDPQPRGLRGERRDLRGRHVPQQEAAAGLLASMPWEVLGVDDIYV